MGDGRQAPGRAREVALLFLKLGAVAFGGPAAHVALFEEEVVRKRGWLDRRHFLDLLGVVQLVPGPNSTEMAIHVGLERAGWRGMLAAGTAFVLPAATLSTLLAWLYVRYGALPGLQPVLEGIKPVVLALIAGAVMRLGRAALRERASAVIGGVALLAALAGAGPLPVLVAGGLTGAALAGRSGAGLGAAGWGVAWGWSGGVATAVTGGAGTAAVVAAATASVSLTALGAAFLQIGAFLYGSGYVLIAFLERALVDERGWLTGQQLVDAVAAGQLTPGPVLSTAAFLGYVLAGVPGAVVATAAIFLPSFVYVAALGRVLPRLRAHPRTAGFLGGVSAAALALIAAVAWRLGGEILGIPVAWTIGAIALAGHLSGRIGAMALILGGAALGWLLL